MKKLISLVMALTVFLSLGSSLRAQDQELAQNKWLDWDNAKFKKLLRDEGASDIILMKGKKDEPPKRDPPRREPTKQKPPRKAPPKREPPRREPPKQEPPRKEPPKRQPPRREPPKQEPPRTEPPKREPPRREPPKQEPPRKEPPRPPKKRPPVLTPPTEDPGSPFPAPTPGKPGRRTEVPKAERIKNREQIIERRDTRQIEHPKVDDRGRDVVEKKLAYAPQRTTIVNKTINNTTIINNITNITNNTSYRDGRHHWRYYDGVRLSYRYDPWGNHWFGFYVGSGYFWTRYHHDRLWWYDPYWSRWCYWRNNRWWWQDPDHIDVVYVYVDNRYYRYDDARNGVVLRPDPTPPVEPPPQEPSQPSEPAPDPDEQIYYSAEGTRSVQVLTKEKRAYLYDRTRQDSDGADIFLVELKRKKTDPEKNLPAEPVKGVTEVEFSDPEDGALLITLRGEMAGKKFVLTFDADGTRLGAAKPQPTQEEQAGKAAPPLQTPDIHDISAQLEPSGAFAPVDFDQTPVAEVQRSE